MIGWNDLVYMQDMNPTACNQAPLNVQKTLTDIRDGNTYTIARIKNRVNDNAYCWMTQNLRIINKTISSTDSDVTKNFTIPASNLSNFNSSTRYQQKTYYDSEKPLYGAYYNWYTATAGTGTSSVTYGDAPSSICPKGWQLPNDNDTSIERSFWGLLDGLGRNSAVREPYNFTTSGVVGDSIITGTDGGFYWSSTISGGEIYALIFGSSNLVPSSKYSSYFGLSVRCVAG